MWHDGAVDQWAEQLGAFGETQGEKAAAVSLDDLPLFAMAEPAPPPRSSAVEDALQAIEPDELSPREALEALYRLKGLGRR